MLIMNILVTGGAGYIGSHIVVELLKLKYNVIIIDNFSNSNEEVLKRLKKITGQEINCYRGDIQHKSILNQVFSKEEIDVVIHMAGLKAVGESVAKPLKYYRNNIDSTLSLLEVMRKNDCKKLIFSSSATVYGDPSELPLKEISRVGVGITNPYGMTKYMIEQILNDVAFSDPSWQITALRYFNPIGAHESGLIGEDPRDTPNNLLPYISQVAVGKLPTLQVFGDDYDTPDGTGVRDYIHVVDLAKGHIAALQNLKPNNHIEFYNLGTGVGVSVLDIVRAFEKASGKNICYDIILRRPGDVASCYADASKAKVELGWSAEKSLEEACSDSWCWQVSRSK